MHLKSITSLLVILCAFSASLSAAPVGGQGTWEISLLPRNLDGNASTIEAYYDTVLNVTWLANANAGAGSSFDDGFSASDAQMTWSNAMAWAASLDINGIDEWRLPTLSPIDGATFDTNFSNNASTDFGYADGTGWIDTNGNPVSALGHMFYVNLGTPGLTL